MINLYAIYGTGGCARSALPLFKSMNLTSEDKIFFIDDNTDNVGKLCDGVKVIDLKSYLNMSSKKKFINIAIANVKIRKKISHKLHELNKTTFFSIISDKSLNLSNIKIGEGSLISPFTTLTTNIIIGKSFNLNLYSYVEHDCIIGDYVTFSPGVKCNGHVFVEDNVFVGSGATIVNGSKNNPIIIGENSIIGAGAIVSKNIPKNSTLVAIPSKRIPINL